MTEATTPRTWALIDTRPFDASTRHATVLGVYDHLYEAEAQWKWQTAQSSSHITLDYQRYVIIELPRAAVHRWGHST